jgi:hypothetical protein
MVYHNYFVLSVLTSADHILACGNIETRPAMSSKAHHSPKIPLIYHQNVSFDT